MNIPLDGDQVKTLLLALNIARYTYEAEAEKDKKNGASRATVKVSKDQAGKFAALFVHLSEESARA